MELVSKIIFLKLNNANIKFLAEELTWRSYIITKALFIAKQVKLINKHKFVQAAPDKDSETLVMHIVALEAPHSAMLVYSSETSLLATLQ